MSASRLSSESIDLTSIAVPRCSTVTDAVRRLANRSTVLRRGSSSHQAAISSDPNSLTVSFPAHRALWSALLHAISRNPQASQHPPLYVVDDGTTGESTSVSQRFLHEFLERWEEDRVHTVTVTSPTAVRTFAATSQLWDHILLLSAGAAAQSSMSSSSSQPIVVVRTDAPMGPSISGQPGIDSSALREFKMPISYWNRIVSIWDAALEKQNDASTADNDAELLQQQAVAGDDQTIDESKGIDGDEATASTAISTMTRPRSAAILDPDTTIPDFSEGLSPSARMAAVRQQQHTRHAGSRFHTHFMKHWRVLQAQYRNYLD